MEMNGNITYKWCDIDKKTPFVYKEEMSQVFVVIYDIPLFSQKKIDLHVRNSV